MMVFGKEVSLDELEAIRKKKSVNSHLVGEAELEADALKEKMLGTQSMKVKAVDSEMLSIRRNEEGRIGCVSSVANIYV